VPTDDVAVETVNTADTLYDMPLFLSTTLYVVVAVAAYA
jgi:hypothetical protein